MKRFWTPADIDAMRARYPHERTDALAAELGRTDRAIYMQANLLGLHKSPEYMASPAACRLRRGDNIGKAYRFPPGLVPWNKGIAHPSTGRAKETQFKTGSVPPNRQPVGYIRLNADGYLHIKTEPGIHKFVPLHRHNWKLEHGEYPAKGTVLVFKDSNRMNCDIGNLECLTRLELLTRNSVHSMPPELAKLVQLRGALNRQINKRAAK